MSAAVDSHRGSVSDELVERIPRADEDLEVGGYPRRLGLTSH